MWDPAGGWRSFKLRLADGALVDEGGFSAASAPRLAPVACRSFDERENRTGLSSLGHYGGC